MLKRHQITVVLFSILMLALFASVPAPVAGGAKLGHPIYAIPAFSRQYGIREHLPCGLSQAQRFRQGLQGRGIQVS